MEIALLDEKKTIKQLVAKTTNKSILEFITKELDANEYNFIVTAENLPVAKKAMADLNKSKDFITAFRKEKVDSESVAIDSFKDNVKEYVALIESKREKIKKDVEVFEREAKDSITKELSLYATKAVKDASLRFEFSEVDTADLIKLGSVTPSGSLKKATTETIDGRVLACKSKQDKYDMRLKDLEIESHRAGLASPLTLVHIQGIIMLDNDSEYERGLENLITDEVNRQNVMKNNLQREADEKAQRDAHQEVLDGQRHIANIFNYIATDNALSIDEKIGSVSDYDFKQFAQLEDFARTKAESVVSELRNLKNSLEQAQKNITVTVADKKVEVTHETIPHTQEEKSEQLNKDTPKVEDGKKIVKVMAMFDILVPSGVNDNQVLSVVNKKLSAAGITSDSLKSLEVVQ